MFGNFSVSVNTFGSLIFVFFVESEHVPIASNREFHFHLSTERLKSAALLTKFPLLLNCFTLFCLLSPSPCRLISFKAFRHSVLLEGGTFISKLGR